MKTYTVHVTRVSSYEVEASDGATDDEIIEAYTDDDPEEVGGETLSMVVDHSDPE